MSKKIFGLSLLALGLAGTAYAAEVPSGDPLGGKVLTKAEFQARGAQMFDQMDANKDGKLDPADRAAHEGQMFDRLDTNKDGAISRAEFGAAHQRGPGGQPDRAAHGDMTMTRGDVPAGPAGQHMRGKHGGGHGGMGMMMLKMADTNKDGAVSRAEFLATHAKLFDMMDANKDGKLTKEERQAAHVKMQAMHGKHDDHRMGDMPMGDMPPPPPVN